MGVAATLPELSECTITMTMAILTDFFTTKERFSSERCLAMANDSHLRKYLEVHSLSSEKVFVSIQLKTYSKLVDGLLKLFAFGLYYSLFHILMIKSSYWVDRVLFNFLFNSFGILGRDWS